MPTIKEEKTDIPKEEPEQVSEDLEPIGKENIANEPLKDTVEKSMEELVEEPAKESTEDSVEEPADESMKLSTEESAEKPAEEYTEEPAVKQVEGSIDEPAEPKDTFVPGSEHFDNSGLQFASRPHLEKSTHLLPEELTPEKVKMVLN